MKDVWLIVYDGETEVPATSDEVGDLGSSRIEREPFSTRVVGLHNLRERAASTG
jgi:hypothetical protein